MKAVFLLPFDPVKKLTQCPAKEWVHKTPEQGASVIAEVEDDEAVIAAMKLDPTYCWLEDIAEVSDAVKG